MTEMANQPVLILGVKPNPDGPKNKSKLQERVDAGEVKTVLYHRVGNVGVYWAIPSKPKAPAV